MNQILIPGFEGWAETLTGIAALAVLVGQIFGSFYWTFVENLKATGKVPDGYAGLVGNVVGVILFGLIGLGVGSFQGTGTVKSLAVGALCGFLVSLNASNRDKIISGQVAKDRAPLLVSR